MAAKKAKAKKPRPKGSFSTKSKQRTVRPAPEHGRGPVVFDFAQFEELCRLHCTKAEIAAVLLVSEDTVQRRCLEHYGKTFDEARADFEAAGRVSLRREQWRQALTGSVRMLVFLGINQLGQTQRTELKHEFSDLSDAELIQKAKTAFAAGIAATARAAPDPATDSAAGTGDDD